MYVNGTSRHRDTFLCTFNPFTAGQIIHSLESTRSISFLFHRTFIHQNQQDLSVSYSIEHSFTRINKIGQFPNP